MNQRTEYGGIAQLGERLNGIQEVSGSIPLISTKKSRIRKNSGLFLLQKRDFQTPQKVIKTKEKAPKSHDFSAFLVEISGIEPLTS